MTERKSGLDYDAGTARERELWNALGELERAEPSARLRRAFYRRLDSASVPGPWSRRLRHWLGGPWVPAAAMLAVGLIAGATLRSPDGNLVRLRQEVASLHRDVALSLMHNRSAAERLKGVIGAAELAPNDPAITRALLRQALEDPSLAVRAAAIDAVGPQVRSPAVAAEVLGLLEAGVSPLVQRSLIDLILRHGGSAELEQLIGLAARDGALHPDLRAYLTRTVKRSGA